MSRHTSKATKGGVSRGKSPARSRRAMVFSLLGLMIVAAGAFWVGTSWFDGSAKDQAGNGSPAATDDSAAAPSGVSAQTPAPIRSGPLLPTPSPSATGEQPEPEGSEGPQPQRAQSEPDEQPGPTAKYELVTSWVDGFVPNFVVSNPDDEPRTFELRLTYPKDFDVKVVKAWNLNVETDANGSLTFTGGPLKPGGEVRAGFQATKAKPDEVNPTTCTINGVTC